MKHRWDMCGMCGPTIICGECGMNMCGGSNRPECKGCESAYEMFKEETGLPHWMRWSWRDGCRPNKQRRHYETRRRRAKVRFDREAFRLPPNLYRKPDRRNHEAKSWDSLAPFLDEVIDAGQG